VQPIDRTKASSDVISDLVIEFIKEI
jgi:hypothetical protein